MLNICKRIRTRLATSCYRMMGSRIGRNSVIHYSCEIQKARGIILKDNCTLYKNVTVYNSPGGEFNMGNNSHVASFGYFLIDKNKISIGENVAIGPNCSFFCHSNDIKKGKLFIDTYVNEDIHIGNNVFIGAHCVILPGTIIGDNAVIAANSVVKGKLESDAVYAGSPALQVKKL